MASVFSVAIDQNEYLAEGAGTVDAVVTVETDADFVAAGPPPERVEILIIDTSGSMGAARKFDGARQATLAALDVLPDGTRFAIVEGTSMARLVFPSDTPSVPASRESRAAARRRLDKLRPNGGTAMGTWLGLARQLSKKHPDAMVHAILLTDGKNEHEEPAALAAEIGLVRAVWTTESELSARISRRVAHYTGQAELAQVVQEGLTARKNGDVDTATAKLRRAVQLAAESSNESTAKLLRGVVEVDERNGTVRLRAKVEAADEMALDARSTKTARVRKEA
jgi:hypothetical protein